MEINKNEKAPTTKSSQDKTYDEDSTDSRNTQAKIVPNKEEKVTEKSLSSYFHNNKGQLLFSYGEAEVMVSATYIKIIGFIRDAEGTNWKAQIEFNDLDGKLKTIAIPRENLMEQKQVTQILASEGYPSFCNKLLHGYLKTEIPKERLIKNNTKWLGKGLLGLYLFIIPNCKFWCKIYLYQR